MTPRKWSNAEKARLAKDFKKNLKYDELASKYGTSPASMRSLLYRMRKDGLIGRRK